MDEVLIQLDNRRRVSLGKLGRPEHRRYLATQHPDGTIILTPAVVMSEFEARFLAIGHLSSGSRTTDVIRNASSAGGRHR